MKFYFLDYLRALGVVLVTYGHIIVFGPESSWFLGPIANHFELLSSQTKFTLVLGKYVNIGEIGVALFFLASGFLIMKSRVGKPVSSFIIRRLQRIYPIAIVGVLISYFALMLTNYLLGQTSFSPLSLNRNDIYALLTNSLLINGFFPTPMENPVFKTSIIVPTFWFLAVIVKYYLLMCFINKLEQSKIVILAFVLLSVSLLFVVFRSSLGLSYLPIFSDLAFSAHHIIYVLIGCSLYITYEEARQIPLSESPGRLNRSFLINNLCALTIGLLFTTSFYALKRVPDFPLPADMIKNYLIAFIIFIACLSGNKLIPEAPKPLRIVSNTSFSVYALHYSLGGCFLALLMSISFLKAQVFILYALVFLLVGLAGFLLYRYVEEPIGRLKIR